MNKKRCSFKHRKVGAREGLKIGAEADRGDKTPKINRIERLVFCSENHMDLCYEHITAVYCVCLVPSRELGAGSEVDLCRMPK